MLKIVKILAATLCLFAFVGRAQATCVGGTNGTVQTLSNLLTQEFQDGQAAGSITPACMRDLIATLGQGNIGMEVDFFMFGLPSASAVLSKAFSRTTVVPSGAAIKCVAIAGATASTTVTLSKVTSGSSTSVGTAVFAASGSAYETCTPTWSSSVTFSPGDLITATFPASPDATAANINISIPALQ